MDFTEHNNAIASLLPKIEAYQDGYLKEHSFYFQGLSTSTVVPKTEVSQDCLTEKPTAKPTTWADTGLIDSSLPFSVTINEYEAPEGGGWQILFRTQDDAGKTYMKSIGYGCEATTRTFEWVVESDFSAQTTKIK